MNLGINKQEAEFLEHTILYFLKSSKLPDLLMDMYPGVNVKDILSQLQYIKELGEDYSEESALRATLSERKGWEKIS